MRIKQILPLQMIIVILLASCSSLPLPGSPTESLLVIAGDIDRNLIDRTSNSYQVSSVKMKLINSETDKEQSLTYNPGDDYITIPIEPGRYKIDSQITVSFKNGNSDSWEDTPSVPTVYFLIEKNVIYVFPKTLELKRRNIGDGAHYDLVLRDSKDLIETAMQTITAERRYKAWDLYPIIGWESRENQ